MTSVISKKHAWAAVGVLLLPMGPADLFAAEKIKLNPGGYMEQGPGWADEADSDYVPDLQSDTEVFFSGKSKLDRGLVVVPRGGEVEVPMDGKTPMKWDGENWTPIPSSGPGKLGKRPKVGGIVDRSLPIGDDGKDDYIMEPDNRSQGDRRRLDSGDDPDAGSGGDESDPYGGEFDDPGHSAMMEGRRQRVARDWPRRWAVCRSAMGRPTSASGSWSSPSPARERTSWTGHAAIQRSARNRPFRRRRKTSRNVLMIGEGSNIRKAEEGERLPRTQRTQRRRRPPPRVRVTSPICLRLRWNIFTRNTTSTRNIPSPCPA